jgi:ParB family transcriptional regulator, chromosome partitioning protein
MSRKSLGRGLDALLPSVSADTVEQVPVTSIDPNPMQPRKLFSAEKLEELARSVANQGVLQPVLVRRKGDRYELVLGERRWRATLQAGLPTIPALVSDRSDDSMLELALIENLQREDLGPLEVAHAYRLLMERSSLTQEQLAERVGKKRSSVANYLRLLDLPEEPKELVENGRLSMGHARALLGLEPGDQQSHLARQVVERDLSVRETEDLVRKSKSAPRSRPAPKAAVPARARVHMDAAEERLSEAFGTPVAIEGSERRGRIVIDYYSREHLDALLVRLEQV